MAKQPSFFFLSLLFFLTIISTESHAAGGSPGLHDGPLKLFVFGDSYADTGNWRKSATPGSWKEPYGITYPGKPSGRFSDGLILTDYLASFFGIKSPVPYEQRNSTRRSDASSGMNFAYGGTGVFNTWINEPNMTTQIDYFQELVERKVYRKDDLNSSIAFVSVAGNDYAAYVLRNGNIQNFRNLTESIIDQISKNLKRIHGLGVAKVVVTTMEPAGCLPQYAAYSSYQKCNGTWNEGCKVHNELLQKAVDALNSKRKQSTFLILDIYQAFISALEQQKHHSGNSVLKPCCVGVSSDYFCGSVDGGAKKYTTCNNPKSAFFWDSIHPAQTGWHAVYKALQPSLAELKHHLPFPSSI